MGIEREDRLDVYIETGIRLDAELSAELLIQIFHVNTPLHDGAVILRGDRVAAASCVMPLSASGTLSAGPERKLGLRPPGAPGRRGGRRPRSLAVLRWFWANLSSLVLALTLGVIVWVVAILNADPAESRELGTP